MSIFIEIVRFQAEFQQIFHFPDFRCFVAGFCSQILVVAVAIRIFVAGWGVVGNLVTGVVYGTRVLIAADSLAIRVGECWAE